MKNKFFYNSADKKTEINALIWIPKNKPKAILQIAHGMTEYILRYDKFANFLNDNDILVCGNDHLGHGNSICSKANLGYFSEKNGHTIVVDDMKKLHDSISQKYKSLPYFIMGHSMGSFLAREYISRYGETIDGAIIMGTGWNPSFTVHSGKALCKIIGGFKGSKYKSKMINNIAFGSYNNKFDDKDHGLAWLTRDKAETKKYREDPLCGFMFSINGFYNLFDVILYVQDSAHINHIPKNLPIFIISGKDDPVGNYGQAPKILYDKYKEAKITKITKRIYINNRHEILNDYDKITVYNDILQWIQNQL